MLRAFPKLLIFYALILTYGGFYKHFVSRDDLVVEAIEESLRELTETLIDSA